MSLYVTICRCYLMILTSAVLIIGIQLEAISTAACKATHGIRTCGATSPITNGTLITIYGKTIK